MAAALVSSTVDRIWRDLDKSHDAHLSFEECKDFLKISFSHQQSLPFSEEQIRTQFNEIDGNKDGRITKGEMALFIIKLTHF